MTIAALRSNSPTNVTLGTAPSLAHTSRQGQGVAVHAFEEGGQRTPTTLVTPPGQTVTAQASVPAHQIASGSADAGRAAVVNELVRGMGPQAPKAAAVLMEALNDPGTRLTLAAWVDHPTRAILVTGDPKYTLPLGAGTLVGKEGILTISPEATAQDVTSAIRALGSPDAPVPSEVVKSLFPPLSARLQDPRAATTLLPLVMASSDGSFPMLALQTLNEALRTDPSSAEIVASWMEHPVRSITLGADTGGIGVKLHQAPNGDAAVILGRDATPRDVNAAVHALGSPSAPPVTTLQVRSFPSAGERLR